MSTLTFAVSSTADEAEYLEALAEAAEGHAKAIKVLESGELGAEFEGNSGVHSELLSQVNDAIEGLGGSIQDLNATEITEANVAKYRHYLMESLGGHFGGIRQVMIGEVDLGNQVNMHVEGASFISSTMHQLFPDGSVGGEALPAIWEEPEDFKLVLDEFQVSMVNAKEAFDKDGLPAFGQALREVGANCKACHDDYRE